ncbi:TlpA disulfide reductase family protein [Xanthomonas sp. 3307]|uniref:TlpA family protein disulfide reductase n=1 Tax=Xanthomonas sp. 3307 TaxID=3035316 RepID=UPI001853ABEC|nr:TlpA disulfide reductase family protein [Xanthomonas sp. 3307]MBB5941424.1 thiol-disulfide isomerase/thioredoxin [Xanthomonas sp. 3307]
MTAMRLLFPLFAAAALLAGCDRQPTPKPADGTATTAPSSSPKPPPAPPAPEAPAAPAAGPSVVQETRPEPTLKMKAVDGREYDLAAHRGQWVVVNFWATWCAPCLKEMPELSALHVMRDNIEVVGLAYEDIEPAEMQAFLKQHPVAYPIVIVDTYAPPADFATPRGLPMTYLIAPDGKVAKQFLGPVNAKGIESAIAAAGGPAPGRGKGKAAG